MNKNINHILNDLLYKNESIPIDLKINNIVNKLIENNQIKNDYLLDILLNKNKERKISKKINYKDYYLYFLQKESNFIYCASSFRQKYENMNYSTFNAFLGLIECLSFKNKFITINYTKKEDKNVFLANTISNILANHLIENYSNFLKDKQHNDELFFKFITEEFKPPRILLTGYENQEEINEMCRTFFDFNNTWVGLRARIFIPEFNEIFYTLNINLDNNENSNNYEFLKSKYYLSKSDLLLNELPNNFIFGAKSIFNNQEVEWNKIPTKIYEKLITPEFKFDIEHEYNELKKEHIFKPCISRKWASYGYRHINEWIYINNWLNNKEDKFDIKNLNYLKPVITANLEQFVELIESGIWNNDNNQLEQFDYVIIDNADKISTKYLPFLQYTFKNIIAFGEFKETNKNISNDAIKNIYKLIANKNTDIDNLLTSLKLNDCVNHQSILEWINQNTNIKTIDDTNEKLNIKKGICL